MLITFLHRLPDLLILLVVLVVITGIAVGAPLIRHRVMRIATDTTREDAAFDGFKAIMGMIGVVLAFSLVQATTNLQSIEGLVGKEGTAFASVDRVLLRTGNPDLANLRPALADFGNKVVNLEWPRLATGDRSPEADAAYTTLSRGVRAIVPRDAREQTMYTELLKQMDDLSELREEVIGASDTALPSFFWVTAAGLLLIGLCLAALTSTNLKQMVGVAATASAVALLLVFVIIVDRPFEGQTSVAPTAIVKALYRNSHRAEFWSQVEPRRA